MHVTHVTYVTHVTRVTHVTCVACVTCITIARPRRQVERGRYALDHRPEEEHLQAGAG